MKPQFTPGPWSIRVAKGTVTLEANDGAEIARNLATYNGQPLSENKEANARLIAAAPDMLEALEEILGAFHGYGDASDELWMAIEKADRAVDKALRGVITFDDD